MVGLNERTQRGEIDHSRAGRAMIPGWKLNVMDMAAQKAMGEVFHVDDVVHEPEIFLDLGVAGIVPIADSRMIKLLEEPGEILLEGDFFDGFPVLNAEPDSESLGMIREAQDHFIGELNVFFLAGLAFGNGLGAELFELG